MTSNALEAKIDSLIRKLKSKKLAERRGAAFALVKIEEEGLIYLGQFLKSEKQPEIRTEIVKAIGEMTFAGVPGILVEALSDRHHDVRKAAAVALAKRKEKSAVNALCIALTDQHIDVRKEAMWALFKIRDPEAVVPLTQRLLDDDKYVRVRGATILGEFGDNRALEPLIQSLKDETEVCVEALRSLGKLGGERAVSAIRQLETHHDPRVRQTVNEVLTQTHQEDKEHFHAGPASVA